MKNNVQYFKAIRSGTARNGAERDGGKIVHLVTKDRYPSWETGICGIEPKGNGWWYPDQEVEVTCKRCVNKLEKAKNGLKPVNKF